MKKILGLLLVMMLVMVGCSQAPVAEEVATEDAIVTEDIVTEEKLDSLKVIMPYGTPTLSMVKMITEKPEIENVTDVDYELLQATDVLVASLINKEADIAIVPTNLAAVLHNKGVGYKIAGSSVWGVLYVASSEEINGIEDLKGREVSLIGRNLTPDAIFRYILTENNIDPDNDLTLNYFSGGSELAANYISKQSNIGMIPQPLLTNVLMKREDSKVVLDLQEEWTKLTGSDKYPQASIVVSEELIASHPETVASFINEYEEAVEWLNENPQEAGAYYEALNIGLNSKIIETAIPTSNLRFVSATDAKEALNSYLNVLYDFNPKLLGGKAVDDTLYFEK